MNFQEAYQWLLSLSNIPKKEYMSDPASCSWYLFRTKELLDLLGNPEKKIPHYIHITGTSGKGSVTTYMHEIIYAAGHTVGSTYSPHPSSIIERWKVNDRYMTEKEFVMLVKKIKPVLDTYIRKTNYDMVSFFEITDIIGLMFFAQRRVRYAVIEVGCGGRYDSTNIIPHKDVAIITNIGLDHVGIIGNNKKEIAYEKAGIITDQTKHAITGEKNKHLSRIIKQEAEKYTIPYSHIHIDNYSHTRSTKKGIQFVYNNNTYHIRAHGNHQIKNAILCIEAAKKLSIPEKYIKQGLAHTTQTLRMEIISDHPLTILDGAHNTDKIKSTIDTMAHLQKIFNIHNVRLIVGFSENKNTSDMLRQLCTLQPTSIVFTRNTTNSFRKTASMKTMLQYMKKRLPACTMEIFLDPLDAYLYTKKITKKNDCILATGSIFMSGELRKHLVD